MNTLKNKVQLIGNLGAAPEIKTLDNGNKLAKFALATNETYRNRDGEKITDTQWHNIVIWGKLAGIVEQYVTKGSHIALEGKLATRKWEDKDGQTRYTTEVIASQLEMLGAKA